MSLRESVIVTTLSGELQGYLFVGADGLPEVRVTEEAVEGDVHQRFTPSQFPAAWYLRAIGEPGVLLGAWRMIQVAQTAIAQAQREAGGADVDA